MPVVRYRSVWGLNKRTDLLSTLEEDSGAVNSNYAELNPSAANRFLLRPGEATERYSGWAGIDQLSRTADWSGVLEKRRGSLMAHDRPSIEKRMARYGDATISFEELRRGGIGPVVDAGRFDAAKARAAFVKAGGTAAGRFVELALYPFDERWCFHTNARPIWNEPRPELAAQQKAGNSFLVTRARARRPEEGFPCFYTSKLPGDHLLDPNAHPLPFVLHVAGDPEGGLGLGSAVVPNLSAAALGWCDALGLARTPETSHLVWYHVLAVAYSPAWLEENGSAIRQGWPRVPLPNTAELLRSSAALGEQVAALLDPHTPVAGVTIGTPRPELATIAVPTTIPGQTRDWRLTAGWGARSAKGITMPGRGRTDKRAFRGAEAATEQHAAILGEATHDVRMNGASFWSNVPERVWEVTIGGYQVLKKWLSYRELTIIERSLHEEEVSHFQGAARRLAALLLLGPELDLNYGACAQAHRRLTAPDDPFSAFGEWSSGSDRIGYSEL